jgi:small multidrug resistance family-3 protein
MTVTRSVVLFLIAAIAAIGGAWMVRQAVREQRGWLWAGGVRVGQEPDATARRG